MFIVIRQGMLVICILLAFVAVPAWAQEKGWQKEWNKVLAAAKKEGKVVLRASSDPAVRRALPPAFEARYGIKVEQLVGRGSQIAARIRVERRARVYTLDVVLTGLGTAATVLYPEKMLDPLKPALIRPDVLDPSKWKKGKLWFLDPEKKYVLRLFNYTTGTGLSINSRYVKPEEFKSIKNLINPKWKGKISVFDPTRSGSGANDVVRLYLQFGEEFVRKLYIDQKPIVSRRNRQLSDWLARGTYPITFGLGTAYVRRLKGEGFPVMTFSSLPDMPSVISAGPVLGLMNQAPHPNAARVFVNWMASSEGMEVFARAKGFATTRKDIDESFVPPEDIPRPGVNYFDVSDWEYLTKKREKIKKRIREILKK